MKDPVWIGTRPAALGARSWPCNPRKRRIGQPLRPHIIAASSSSRRTVAKLVAESLMA